VECYKPGRIDDRKETWSELQPEGRWRCYSYDELIKRDKLSLDLFWIKDKTLTDTDSLPSPDVLASEIADDLEARSSNSRRLLLDFARATERLTRAHDCQRCITSCRSTVSSASSTSSRATSAGCSAPRSVCALSVRCRQQVGW